MFHIFSIHFWTSFGFGLKSCGPCKTCTFWMIISIFLNLFVNGRGIGWNDAALIGIQILQYHLLKGKICGVPFQLLIMLKLTSPLFSNNELNRLCFLVWNNLSMSYLQPIVLLFIWNTSVTQNLITNIKTAFFLFIIVCTNNNWNYK